VSPVPSPAGSAGQWRAVLDDGREIAVDGLILLGRNPQPRPGEEHATLIKVADTTRTVSKSHLEIGVRGSGLYVVDRGSTNGSTVTGMSGTSQRCAPGERIPVESGSIVSFGDHWLEIRSS
jgi:pSer/pThr/pTyr-binding forkhead associated (FHA) protein